MAGDNTNRAVPFGPRPDPPSDPEYHTTASFTIALNMLLKHRLHLFEFSDLPRLPKLLRTYGLEYLMAVAERYEPFTPGVSHVLRALEAASTDQVVDLCSGVGGPWPHLAAEIARQRGKPPRLTLSDKHPNVTVESALAAIPGTGYVRESVDARHVPPHLVGLRTLFNSFHHFRPDEARQILQDAVRNGQPIAVFEMLKRSWSCLALLLFTPLLVMIVTLKMRPFRLSRLLLTFLVPIIPLLMLWDSVVSVLRCYTPQELLAMAGGLEGKPYVWHAGTYRRRILSVTYLVGYHGPIEGGAAPVGDRSAK